jgi:hypothetical protein
LPFGGFCSQYILNIIIDINNTKTISVGQANVLKNEVLQIDCFVVHTPLAYEEASSIINTK